MLNSILNDVRQNFTIGNMVTKLIIVNVMVYVICALLIAFNGLYPFGVVIDRYLSISASPGVFLWKPWTLITNMFLHVGFFHLLWNMVGLNLFGRIVGDLLGDRKILPLYLFGGFLASITFIISAQWQQPALMTAHGASGAIMALAMTAGLIAPDYIVRLILLGDVKIKYIVMAFLFFDIIGAQGMVNSGGHFAHLGGMLAGFLYITLYKKGFDVLRPLEQLQQLFFDKKLKETRTKRPMLRVEHRAESLYNAQTQKIKNKTVEEVSFQEKLDAILDKIKDKGYDKLNEEEKQFLSEASKKE